MRYSSQILVATVLCLMCAAGAQGASSAILPSQNAPSTTAPQPEQGAAPTASPTPAISSTTSQSPGASPSPTVVPLPVAPAPATGPSSITSAPYGEITGVVKSGNVPLPGVAV